MPLVHRSEWLRATEDSRHSPTAMLIEQPPHSSLPGHYHRHNEFQVVILGSGTIGRHAVRPIAVHYAGAYTGYGPLVASADGLGYLTMRAVYERGVLIGPQHMVRGPKKQAHLPPLDAAPPAHDSIVDELIACDDEHLAAQRVRLSAGMAPRAFDPAGSAGQFHLVIAGEGRVAGHRLGLLDMLYVSPDEPAPALEGGDGGLDLLVLQLPRETAPYRDPADADWRGAATTSPMR